MKPPGGRWSARGLIQSMFPRACVLTPAGHSYDTGMRQSMLHEAHHH